MYWREMNLFLLKKHIFEKKQTSYLCKWLKFVLKKFSTHNLVHKKQHEAKPKMPF